MSESENWTTGVKKYISDPDDLAINGIIKHCGIALKSRDASFVSCTDKNERDRVRENFLKKKLRIAESDGELDKAVLDVCAKMKDDRDKHRVTFYYLLAEKYGKLGMFHS